MLLTLIQRLFRELVSSFSKAREIFSTGLTRVTFSARHVVGVLLVAIAAELFARIIDERLISPHGHALLIAMMNSPWSVSIALTIYILILASKKEL